VLLIVLVIELVLDAFLDLAFTFYATPWQAKPGSLTFKMGCD